MQGTSWVASTGLLSSADGVETLMDVCRECIASGRLAGARSVADMLEQALEEHSAKRKHEVGGLPDGSKHSPTRTVQNRQNSERNPETGISAGIRPRLRLCFGPELAQRQQALGRVAHAHAVDGGGDVAARIETSELRGLDEAIRNRRNFGAANRT